MRTDEIRLLYKYNYWANRRTLTVGAGASPEQYVILTEPAILSTRHVYSAAWPGRLEERNPLIPINR